MVRACHELGIKRVAYLNPNVGSAQGEYFEEYMRACSVDPVFHGSLGIRGHQDQREQPSLGELRRAVMQKDLGAAEAVCLLMTGIFYADSVQALELDLKRPVFAAGPVTLWAALRLGGYSAPIYGFGSLLAEH
jgi:maleate cis-trans isomerase